MVFGRRAETPADKLKKKDEALFEKRWGWNYIQHHFKDGDRVYSPLYDMEFTIEDIDPGDHWLFCETYDDMLSFCAFEVQKV